MTLQHASRQFLGNMKVPSWSQIGLAHIHVMCSRVNSCRVQMLVISRWQALDWKVWRSMSIWSHLSLLLLFAWQKCLENIPERAFKRCSLHFQNIYHTQFLLAFIKHLISHFFLLFASLLWVNSYQLITKSFVSKQNTWAGECDGPGSTGLPVPFPWSQGQICTCYRMTE